MTPPTKRQLEILEDDMADHETRDVPKMLADVETLRALLDSWKALCERTGTPMVSEA